MTTTKKVQVNGYKNKTLKYSVQAVNAMERAILISKMEQLGLRVECVEE